MDKGSSPTPGAELVELYKRILLKYFSIRIRMEC